MDPAGVADMPRRQNMVDRSTEETEPNRPRRSDGHPAGNRAMKLYRQQVNSGPHPWEIDETGFVIWSLWGHFVRTHDVAYLRRVYPTIRRAADFLVQCRDPNTGLQCYSTEDDNFRLYQQQTILGASTTWLGLDRAARAAQVLGEGADLARYRDRERELGAAIDAHFWDPADHDYGGSWGAGSYL